MYLDSAYRDFYDQVHIGGLSETPGKTQHHTGRAVDFKFGGYLSDKKTPRPLYESEKPIYNWLVNNAEEYGFYQTYSSEKWHWFYNPKVKSSENLEEYENNDSPGTNTNLKWVAFDDMNIETDTEKEGDRRIRPLYDAEEKSLSYLKPVPKEYLTGGNSYFPAKKTNKIVKTKEECLGVTKESVSDLIRYDERIDKYMKGFLNEAASKVDHFNQILKDDGNFEKSTAGYSDFNIDSNKIWRCTSNDFKILLFYRDLKWQTGLWCDDPVFTALPGQSAHMTGRVFDLVVSSSTRCIGYPKIFNEIRKIAENWGFYATEYDTPDPDLCNRLKLAEKELGDCKTDVLWEWWHWEYNPPITKATTPIPIIEQAKAL
jgi:hypothetical protein